MKRRAKILCAIMSILMAFSAVSFIGCGGSDGDSDEELGNRSSLKVYAFASGYGQEWLTSLIKDYEEANANTSFEEGKVGIKIEPTAQKSTVDGSDLKNRDEVIYFLEQQDYYTLTNNNYLSDITSAITGENKYETGKTLESKLFDSQKSYLKRDGKYYAYPHYFTSSCITYDVELFDEMGFYFADGYTRPATVTDSNRATMFVNTTTRTVKTAGPDGQQGTSDDGLPTNYTEFLDLCDYINSCNYNPLCWADSCSSSYLNQLVNALAAESEGYEQMMLNFTFKGEAKTLGTISDDTFVRDANTTTLNGVNGYEVARQEGKYRAMKFYSDLYSRDYIKNNEDLNKSSVSNTDAQDMFLVKNNHYAMLVDGSWWQCEATSTIDLQAKANSSLSKQNRKLAYMPLPKYDGCTTTGDTMFDIMYPLMFVKKLDTTDWRYSAAIDFIQFANTDAQLAKFTQITGCTKALDYTIENAETTLNNPYAYSYYKAYRSAVDNNSVVFPYDNNSIFVNAQNQFSVINWDSNGIYLYKSSAYATFFTEAIEKGIKGKDGGVSVNDYFTGMYTYFKNNTSIKWQIL